MDSLQAVTVPAAAKRARSLLFLIILIPLVSACGGGPLGTSSPKSDSAKAGVPGLGDSSSMEYLLQGIKYIRENPTGREDELVQRYLWLDQWMAVLQSKGKLNAEVGQEFWEDLNSFVKNETMTIDGLEKIRARAKSSIGKNVVLYELYQNVLRASSIQEAMRYLQVVEEDGVTNIYSRAQELLQLQSVGASADSRRIGVLLPLSGPNRDLGEEVMLAIQLVSTFALSEGVEFVIEDTGSTDESLLAAFNRLAVDMQVTAILGPITNKDSELVFERAQILSVPVISMAPRENLDLFGRYSYRSTVKIADQVDAASKFIRDELRARRVAVLVPDSKYGFDVIQEVNRSFRDNGLDLVDLQIFPKGATDFKAPLQKISRLDLPKLRRFELCPKDKEAPQPEGCVTNLKYLQPMMDFEVLLFADYAKTAGQFLTHLPFLKLYGVQVVGLSGFNSPVLVERAGAAAEGVAFVDGYLPDVPDFQTRLFLEDFEALGGRKPSRLAAEAFDLGLLTVNIFKKVLGPISRDRFLDDLKGLTNFPGVTGQIFLDGHEIRRIPKNIVVRGGKFRLWRR